MTIHTDNKGNFRKIEEEIIQSSFEKQLSKQFAEATGHHIEKFLEQAKQEGRQEAFKEVGELIDGKTIECVLLYGEWWMKLNEFKEKLKAK